MKTDILSLDAGEVVVNGINFSSMTAEEHKRRVFDGSAHNYSQIPKWLIDAPGGDCELVLRKTVDGKEKVSLVLDFQSMYSTNNLGYGKLYKEIVDRVNMYLQIGSATAIPRAMDHALHAPALEAIKTFTGLDRIIMKSTGAEAVETAVNIALKHWHAHAQHAPHSILYEPPYIISATNCFHGRTRLARSLSSSPSSREGYGPFLQNILHVTFGNVSDIANTIERVKRKNIAAIILEPIQGEGGVIVPPDDYLSQVADICKKHDILLILDEVQTGFGRTGTDWAFEYYGVKPDLLCSGKAAGCGITPVSFVAGRDDVMLSVKEGTEGATWSATPLQCLLVLSAIKTLSDNDLSAASRHKGMVLRGLLGELVGKHPGSITDIRGRGLFVGIDTVFNGKDVSKLLLEEGVWAKETGEKGKTLRLSPPLIISEKELETAVSAFDRVLKRLTKTAT